MHHRQALLFAIASTILLITIACAETSSLPNWVTRLAAEQPESVIKEVSYKGQRAFVVRPSDRSFDAGNEFVLHAEDGRIICEYGGLAIEITSGSCDIDKIVTVKTL